MITKISFSDGTDRNWETQHTIDNSSESARQVHVDQVNPVPVDRDGATTDPSPTADTSQNLYVERIEQWPSIDATDRNWETQISIDNVTGNDQLPPHFLTHLSTHIYRYFQDPQNPDDNGVWIDSELIDKFSFIDASDRHQETIYELIKNPTNAQFRDGDTSGQASDTDEDITIGGDAEGTQENPIRLDPFQNIVNFQGGATFFTMQLNLTVDTSSLSNSDVHYSFATDSGVNRSINPPPAGYPLGPPPPNINNGHPPLTLMAAYLSHYKLSATSEAEFFPLSGPPITGPGPAVSLSQTDFNFSPWQVLGVLGTNPGASFQVAPGGPEQVGFDYNAGSGTDSSVVGPPLLVGGSPIDGFLDTLVCTFRRSGAVFDSGPYQFSDLLPPAGVADTGNYWNYEAGLYTPAGGAEDTGTFTLTMSQVPFEFNGSMWKAVGISDFINSDHNTSQIEIYCVTV